MMGPVLRNLDKKGCVNKGIIMWPKQNLLLQNKGGGGGGGSSKDRIPCILPALQ